MSSIEDLRADLWRRWRFHLEHPVLEHPAGSDGRIVYARVPIFDLKTFTQRKFPAGGRVSAEPFPGEDSYVYELDEKKRPLTMSCRSTVGGVSWLGLYGYSLDELEYTEFCIETEVPGKYERAVFHNGQPVSFQRLMVNGKGAYPIWRGRGSEKAQRLREITSNPGNYRIWIEEYETADGLVRSGRGYVEGMGAAHNHFTLSYSYSDDGRLQRVIRHWANGDRQTVFAARSNITMRALAATLSQKIAARTVEALGEVSFQAPLASVELSYRSVTDYVPIIIPRTELDGVFDHHITRQRMIELPQEDFEPEMADFMQRLESSDRYQAGTRMLREAARLLTKLNGAQATTANGFVAFAIDWEFEGHDLLKVLKDCGADSHALRVWRERGWLHKR